ncbi:MAG: hypothetical protein QF890_04505 [Myxococcota bacterium]|jgi:hypothetical protein|nr:hypothetical protein [Deltaproteobacteria bacterium]MCP4240069.1 hypothetical protein [bacterium]MDP7073562.1 hypothetical protein [Myxococcota bacterium]MDP7431818.1 hypothetical protein [Myxococcota bacterium]MDP7572001.1 hypothetical protein [Myxococcota bacterium]
MSETCKPVGGFPFSADSKGGFRAVRGDPEKLRGVGAASVRDPGKQFAGGRLNTAGVLERIVWSEEYAGAWGPDLTMPAAGTSLVGSCALLVAGVPLSAQGGYWSHELLWSRAGTICAGTSEVQRSLIAEGVLRMPRD